MKTEIAGGQPRSGERGHLAVYFGSSIVDFEGARRKVVYMDFVRGLSNKTDNPGCRIDSPYVLPRPLRSKMGYTLSKKK